jgi:tetratricopeptide (TPR) repeat protein
MVVLTINLIFCCLTMFGTVEGAAQPVELLQADRLFQARDNRDSLKQAVSLLQQSLKQSPSDYQALWRLSKFNYYLGDQESQESGKIGLFEEAIEFGKQAVARASGRPEGHFWLAVSYGRYAELKGVLRSLWLLRTIRAEFDTTFELDSRFENGAVYLALGEMNLRLPRLLGGNQERGISFLESGLKVGPQNLELTCVLAETYVRIGRKNEGTRLLESAMTLEDPLRSPKEVAEIKARAQRLLEQLHRN